MRLSRALNEKKLDVRLRDKLVAEKKVEAKTVESYLNELPDDANNLTYTNDHEEAGNSNNSAE
jgi:hypothetical protein